MTAFFRLIRWKNILVVALTMFAMKYAIIVPVYKFYGLDPGLSKTGFMFLVASVMFIVSGGNVINDYFDRKTDMINRPGKVLVGFQIRRRKVIFMHVILSVFGVLCGFVTAWMTGKLWLGFSFIIVVIMLWSYSSKLKKRFFSGNITLALLIGLIPFIVAVTEYYAFERSIPEWTLDNIHAVKISVETITGFSVFAFLFSLIHNIVKDCENYEGDIATGIKSVPVVLGKGKTNIIISVLTFLSMSLIIIVWHAYFSHLMFFKNDRFSTFYIYSMIIFPGLIIAVTSLWGVSKKKYSVLRILSKFIMITGVIYSILFSFAVYGSI
jgi:4-hydroxybenzoate polyprenyltransferase